MAQQYIGYTFHDVGRNIRGELTTFNQEVLKAMHEAGIEFMGITFDGEQVAVPWDEITPPDRSGDTIRIPVISHEVFMMVMEPIVDAIADLESDQVKSPIATLAAKPLANTSKVRAAYQQALDIFKRDFPDGYGDE